MELLHRDITEQIIGAAFNEDRGEIQPRINTEETRKIQDSGLVG